MKVLIFALVTMASLCGQAFTKGKRVHDNPPGTHEPDAYSRKQSVAIDSAGTVYAVWEDYRAQNADIYLAKSTDGGTTFATNVRVDDSGSSYTDQISPCIAVDASGKIHVAWEDYRNENADIYYCTSSDGGQTFSPSVRVDDTGSATSYQGSPAIAVAPGGSVYIAWSDSRNGNDDIFFARKIPYTAGFSINVQVNDSSDSAQTNPAIAFSPDSIIHVAWVDYRNGYSDIYCSRSTDFGTTFEKNLKITDYAFGYASAPSIAAGSDSSVHIVWSDTRTSFAHIYYSKSVDSGKSFGNSVRVDDTQDTSAQQFAPSVTVDSAGKIHVAFYDYRNSDSDIYYTKSTDGGKTFLQNVRVDDTAGTQANQFVPSIAVDGAGKIHVIFYDNRNSNNYSVYHGRSDNSGTGFVANVLVTDTDPVSFQTDPAIAIDASGAIHIAWTDDRDGIAHVYYTVSNDGGKTFAPEIRADDTADQNFSQSNPALAVDAAGNVYTVWEDSRFGQTAIFSSKKASQSQVFDANVAIAIPGGNSWMSSPSIALTSTGTIHVVWQQTTYSKKSYNFVPKPPKITHRIYYSKSTDGGTSFTGGILVDGLAYTNQFQPDIAAAADNSIHIAWSATTKDGNRITYCSSTDDGASFTPSLAVDPQSTSSSQNSVSIAADSTAHIAWVDSRNGNSDVYYARFNSGTFDQSVLVTPSASEQEAPSIAAIGGQVFIVFEDYDGAISTLRLSQSQDAVTFSEPSTVNPDGGNQILPQIAIDSAGDLHVVWEANREKAWDENIYYARTDLSAPTAGIVNDGESTDIDVQSDESSLSANWQGFVDNETGITQYEWAIGTAPFGTDVRDFEIADGTSAKADELTLTFGTTYYVTVRATNGIGATSLATSDGVKIGNTIPEQPKGMHHRGKFYPVCFVSGGNGTTFLPLLAAPILLFLTARWRRWCC